MFDVYSDTSAFSGKLVERTDNTLIYSNAYQKDEGQAPVALPAGSSYEVIVEDGEDLHINFETEAGRGDGVSEEVLLKMMIHRGSVIPIGEGDEKRLLAYRAMQMALDALQH